MIIAGPLADYFGIVNFFIALSVLGIIIHLIIWFATGLIKVDFDTILKQKQQKVDSSETDEEMERKEDVLAFG